MADRIMENYARMNGVYNGMLLTPSDSTTVSVRLADIPFTKTADREIWLSGPLTFTITVDNSNAGNEGPLTSVIIADQLDTSMFALDMSSIVVAIDGTALVLDTDYTVTYIGGELTVNLSPTVEVAVGQVLTLSFQGNKVP